ncbi:hypothetical protein D9615_010471 [Tricholomella constricta]|uniref:Uncharacterized protein n=1 Tax=Tricholomella constricta TaxID=117010 RepID=A0A8H5GMT0_9AGAR|nr:hypothetical protein D9615_010471 [Tricholomella constricta]
MTPLCATAPPDMIRHISMKGDGEEDVEEGALCEVAQTVLDLLMYCLSRRCTTTRHPLHGPALRLRRHSLRTGISFRAPSLRVPRISAFILTPYAFSPTPSSSALGLDTTCTSRTPSSFFLSSPAPFTKSTTIKNKDFLRDFLVKSAYVSSPPSLTFAQALDIPAFIDFPGLKVDKVLDPLDSLVQTFNANASPLLELIDKLSHSYRLVSAADCRLMIFVTIDEATRHWIKGCKFTVQRLDKGQSDRYIGDALAIFGLAPYFQSPMEGKLGPTIFLTGEYYTINPQAVCSSLDVCGENVRKVVPIDSSQFGRVIVVCVGAMMVGSIKTKVEEGEQVLRGQKFRYLAFGVSTIVVLFEKDRVMWDEDLFVKLLPAFEKHSTRKRPSSSNAVQKQDPEALSCICGLTVDHRPRHRAHNRALFAVHDRRRLRHSRRTRPLQPRDAPPPRWLTAYPDTPPPLSPCRPPSLSPSDAYLADPLIVYAYLSLPKPFIHVLDTLRPRTQRLHRRRPHSFCQERVPPQRRLSPHLVPSRPSSPPQEDPPNPCVSEQVQTCTALVQKIWRPFAKSAVMPEHRASLGRYECWFVMGAYPLEAKHNDD